MKSYVFYILALPFLFFSSNLVYSKPDSSSDLSHFVRNTLQSIDHLRHTHTKHAVPMIYWDQTQIKNFITKRVHQHYSKGFRESFHKLLQIHKLIPKGFTYFPTLINIATTMVAGLYDEHNHRLILKKDLPQSQLKIVLSHEIFHAWQDQHFNLSALVNPEKYNQDQLFAIQSLIEGDATFMMLSHLHQKFRQSPQNFKAWHQTFRTHLENSIDQISPHLPPFMKAQLLAPYLLGVDWIYELIQKNKIQDIYQTPPRSSEQIMHIDTYLTQEDPYHIFFDSTQFVQHLIRDQFTIHSNDNTIWPHTLGEWYWYQFLKNHISPHQARTASMGWAGDLSIVFADYSCSLTVWDSLSDAQEFAQSIYAWYQKHDDSHTKNHHSLLLQKTTKQVAFCLGSSNQKLLDAFWQSSSIKL